MYGASYFTEKFYLIEIYFIFSIYFMKSFSAFNIHFVVSTVYCYLLLLFIHSIFSLQDYQNRLSLISLLSPIWSRLWAMRVRDLFAQTVRRRELPSWKSWLKWQTNDMQRKIRRTSNSWISSLEHIYRTELSSYIGAPRCRATMSSSAKLK